MKVPDNEEQLPDFPVPPFFEERRQSLAWRRDARDDGDGFLYGGEWWGCGCLVLIVISIIALLFFGIK